LKLLRAGKERTFSRFLAGIPCRLQTKIRILAYQEGARLSNVRRGAYSGHLLTR
jgi:hypothetical protein